MKFPPLNALRAFEAAGRHQSFLLAARELHVSAASVSRFVKLLEADLGCTLFIRAANGVRLTDVGEKYLNTIRPPLQTIATVSQSYRQQKYQRGLQIISIPAIAETWLVNCLWNFQQQHKTIEINLVIDDRAVDFRNDDTTIWLNYSDGNLDGTASFALPEDRLILVCSPQIAHTLKVPADIFNYPLLVDIDWTNDWLTWLQAARLPTIIPDNHVIFERYSMVVNAAIASSGVAIGHSTLLESYLQMGTLVTPFAINAVSQKQFYAVIAKHPKRRSVKQFINWFMGETVFTV